MSIKPSDCLIFHFPPSHFLFTGEMKLRVWLVTRTGQAVDFVFLNREFILTPHSSSLCSVLDCDDYFAIFSPSHHITHDNTPTLFMLVYLFILQEAQLIPRRRDEESERASQVSILKRLERFRDLLRRLQCMKIHTHLTIMPCDVYYCLMMWTD